MNYCGAPDAGGSRLHDLLGRPIYALHERLYTLLDYGLLISWVEEGAPYLIIQPNHEEARAAGMGAHCRYCCSLRKDIRAKIEPPRPLRASIVWKEITPDPTVEPHHIQARGSFHEAQSGDCRSWAKHIVANRKPVTPLIGVLWVWEKLTPYPPAAMSFVKPNHKEACPTGTSAYCRYCCILGKTFGPRSNQPDHSGRPSLGKKLLHTLLSNPIT